MPLEPPAQAPESPSHIDIFDFSPGIYSDVIAQAQGGATSFKGSTVGNDARASMAGTYGCYADDNGYLRPLPAKGPYPYGIDSANTAPTRTSPCIPTVLGDVNFQPTGLLGEYLLDACVFGPYRAASIQSDAKLNRPDPDILFSLYGFFASPSNSYPAGNGTYNWYTMGHRYVIGYTGPTAAGDSRIDIAYHRSVSVAGAGLTAAADQLQIGAGMLIKSRSVPLAGVFPWASYTLIPYIGMLVTSTGGVNQEAILAPAGNEIGWNNAMADVVPPGAIFMGGGGSGWQTFWTFPNLATPAVNSTIRVNWLGQYGLLLLGHQGRAVTIGTYPHNLGAGVFTNGEMLFYSDVQQVGVVTPVGAGNLAVGEENPSLYGAACSMAANELILIKHSGGAILVRGDLDNPNVLRLPFVESTGGIISAGCASPVGFVYLTRSGVFSWTGGLTANKLSKQIEGYQPFNNFVATTQEAAVTGSRGRFAYWDPFVCCPRNWLYNTHNQSWWRLEDVNHVQEVLPSTDYEAATPYGCYDVSPQTGSLYAFPYRLGAGPSPVGTTHAFRYSWNELITNYRSHFRWTSQPIMRSFDRYMVLQDIELAAIPVTTGTGIVTVILTGYDENGSLTGASTVIFSMALGTAGIPLYQGQNVPNIPKCRSFTISIAADTDTPSPGAPSIMGIRVGYRLAQMVAKI